MDKIRKNLIKNIVILTVSIAVIILLICLLALKYFLSYSLIEDKFKENFDIKIEFIEPKTYLSPNLNLNSQAKLINFYNINSGEKIAIIEQPSFSMKPFNLIFKKLNIKKINAEKVEINISKDKNGQLNIPEKIFKANLFNLQNKNIKLTQFNSNIKNIEINFDNNYQIKNKFSIKLNDSNIAISKKKKSLKITQKGTIETKLNKNTQISNLNIDIASKYPFQAPNSNDLKTNIDIKNINLLIFNDIAKKYISNDIISLAGIANLNINNNNEELNQKLNLTINNPTLKLKNGKTISPFKNNIIANALFSLHKNEIEIKDLNINSNDLSINTKGKILKPFSKKQSINIETLISNTQLNNLLYFLPDNLIFYRPSGIPALKKSNFHANLNGKLQISLLPINITGNIVASNVHIPNYPKPYKQNNVNALFMKDKVRIYTRVYTPENEYVAVDGISNIDNSLYGKYSVKSTKKIDLSFAQLYLVPIQQIIGFNIGPVPIMDISGYGNIDIKTQGTIKDAQVFGEFSAYSASAKIEGLNAQLKNGNCKLIFDNKNIIFKEIKGKLDNADFLLTGMGNTKGEVDLNTKIKNASTHNILKIFNNSLISKPYTKLTKDIAATSGKMEADINLKGTIKDYEDKNLLNELSPSGRILFNDNKIILNNKLGAQKITGVLNFGKTQNGIIEFLINNTKLKLQFSSKDSLDKISKGQPFEIKNELYSNQIAFNDILKELQKTPLLNKTYSNLLNKFDDINFFAKIYLKSEGKITLDNIKLEELKNSGYLIGLNSKNSSLNFDSGIIKINNNKLLFDNFATTINEGKIITKGYIDEIFSKKPIGNLTINLKNINLDKISEIIPKLTLNSSKINSGQILFKNNDIKFNSMSLNYESMPLFLNAQIKDIYTTRQLISDFSTILNETTVDSIINPFLTYPIKVKGEVPIKGTFKGTSNKYIIDSILTLPKEADIQYSGANLGDTNHKRELQTKLEVNQNVATIHNLKFIKYIANQNNKINPLIALRASGQAIQNNKEIEYKNLKITTNSPINVRILNLLFKKSILKQGNFECDISLNGNSKNPNTNGRILLQDLDIPLYNTKINKININILGKIIDAQILAKNNQSDLTIFLKMLNNLSAPYTVEKIDIISNKLDIKDILTILSPQTQKNDILAKQEIPIKPQDIIVKAGKFDFKEVQYENINAQNLTGNFNYKDNLFNLKDVILNIAQGTIKASGNYDFTTTKLNLIANMAECDSNTLTNDFLNIQNQIFGKMNGSLTLSANNLNTPQGINSVKSDVNFSINNGKMPKLGSLEYLLRAGNIIKNGLLGLSLNNIIEVLTPYKTGEFEKISGNATISNGKIENLEILSQGKNLSLYLTGDYHLLENLANIKIYGKLSQNVSNALGALGNASINQFINTIASKKIKTSKDEKLLEMLERIPPIENQDTQPKYFSAKVHGDINKENYIKSFNWE